MTPPIIVSLPISDRRSSHDFYCAFLALEAFGETAEDGIPEPLQFALRDGVSLMLVPRGGFGWVVEAAAEVAGPGQISALLSLEAATAADVDEFTGRAPAAGGTVLRAARREEWGYGSLVADPDGHVWQMVAPVR